MRSYNLNLSRNVKERRNGWWSDDVGLYNDIKKSGINSFHASTSELPFLYFQASGKPLIDDQYLSIISSRVVF